MSEDEKSPKKRDGQSGYDSDRYKLWYKNNKDKVKLRHKEYDLKNKEKNKARHKKYHEKNKEKILLKVKTYNTKNKEIIRDRQLKRNYNITSEHYKDMLRKQDNKCFICKKAERSNKRLAVDHCHDTGAVRGLLCYSCNVKLGWFEKFKEIVLEYLR